MAKTLAELAQAQRSLTDILTGIGQRGTNVVRQVSGGVQSVGQHIADNRANALAGLPNEPVTTRSGVPFPSERQYMENLYNTGDWVGGGGVGTVKNTAQSTAKTIAKNAAQYDDELARIGRMNEQTYGEQFWRGGDDNGLFYTRDKKYAEGFARDGKKLDSYRVLKGTPIFSTNMSYDSTLLTDIARDARAAGDTVLADIFDEVAKNNKRVNGAEIFQSLRVNSARKHALDYLADRGFALVDHGRDIQRTNLVSPSVRSETRAKFLDRTSGSVLAGSAGLAAAQKERDAK